MAGTRRGVIAALLSLPLLAAVYNRHDGLEALEWIGVAVWLAGLVCEVQADRQLERFRRDPSNPGGRDRQGAVALLPAPELLRPVADVVRLRARRPRGAVGLGRATVARAQPPPDPLRQPVCPRSNGRCSPRGARRTAATSAGPACSSPCRRVEPAAHGGRADGTTADISPCRLARRLLVPGSVASCDAARRRVPRLGRAAFAGDELAQALVLLAAGGAAAEVGAQTGDRRVRVHPREFELDVPVELLEAPVAAHLGASRSEETAEQQGRVLFQQCSSVSSGAWPHSSRCRRSLRRASCRVV